MSELDLLVQISGQLQDVLLVCVAGLVLGTLRLGVLAFIAGNQR